MIPRSADPAQERTSVKQAPCPKCRCEDYICVSRVFRCKDCGLSRATASQNIGAFAQVNEQGHLLCQGCNTANEYAMADANGAYVCTSCKTTPAS